MKFSKTIKSKFDDFGFFAKSKLPFDNLPQECFGKKTMICNYGQSTGLLIIFKH